ncbi:isocitrate lyase/phosphoenolpyruvate mutase family protein [Pseudoalteromonas piscicida]|uniref:isocitrate lyase/phosphoenolpyruvate mutase family protein n=1 Tax=Pseudoalteromonas piscicida TaxID=43662 RepID=UPI0021D51647|nr:isocitrate lyase/phosphoenolpyruvate mutase family protein [Pseudoalteromonas piscicida]
MITTPLSVDIETGYSAGQHQIIKHIIQLADLGVAGINIEDKPSNQSSLRDIKAHQALLQAIKQALRHGGFDHFLLMPVAIFAYNHSGRKRHCMSVHSPIKQQVAMVFLFPV